MPLRSRRLLLSHVDPGGALADYRSDPSWDTPVTPAEAAAKARNTASAARLRRLGFTREGCRRAHSWIKGGWTDDLLFGLLAHDGEASRP